MLVVIVIILVQIFHQSLQKQDIRSSCHYDLQILWSYQLGHSPIIASPLIGDIDADGIKEVLIASYADQYTILKANNGEHLTGAWPLHMKEITVYSSPFMYDIDNDSILDSAIVTYNGDILFFRNNGSKINYKKLKIPSHKVQYPYQQNDTTIGFAHNTNSKPKKIMLHVDPHVLTTPVIADINGDGVEEELVLAVNWFFDSDDIKNSKIRRSKIDKEVIENNLYCGIVIFNLTNGRIIKKVIVESSKMSSYYRPYAMAPPTLLNLKPEIKPDLDIIVGTLSGNLYVVNLSSTHFPEPVLIADNIQGQVTIADLTDNEGLEMIITDSSANVHCLSLKYEVLWYATLSGTFIAGSRIADVNSDGNLDVVIACNDGYIWALDGRSGTVLNNWPINVHHRLQSTVLVTHFRNDSLHLIISSVDGYLLILNIKSQCLEVLRVGVHTVGSAVQVLTDDIVKESPGMELILSTLDGRIICLGEARVIEVNQRSLTRFNAWPFETLSYNGFALRAQYVGIAIDDCPHQVNAKQFTLKFHIYDKRNFVQKKYYHVKIYIGSKKILFEKTYYRSGDFEEVLNSISVVQKVLLTVQLITESSETVKDSVAVSFHNTLEMELQIWLLGSFIYLMAFLLVLHGIPDRQWLPVSRRT